MSDEAILHFNLVRIRVVGSGNLKLTMKGLDANPTVNLTPIAMAAGPGREPTQLANFINQRCTLRVYVTDINENFKINRIILYAKPLWAQYPG